MASCLFVDGSRSKRLLAKSGAHLLIFRRQTRLLLSLGGSPSKFVSAWRWYLKPPSRSTPILLHLNEMILTRVARFQGRHKLNEAEPTSSSNKFRAIQLKSPPWNYATVWSMFLWRQHCRRTSRGWFQVLATLRVLKIQVPGRRVPGTDFNSNIIGRRNRIPAMLRIVWGLKEERFRDQMKTQRRTQFHPCEAK